MSWVVQVVKEALKGQHEMRRVRQQALPFKRPRGHGRSVADAQLGRLFILFFKVFLGKSGEPLAIFLLDYRALAIELLDVFEPCDAVANPHVGGFKAILGDGWLVGGILRMTVSKSP